MDTFYEPLLELEAFGQIREQLKKEEGLHADHGLCGFSEDSSDVQSGKRLACEIDPYL